jgi:hypothetical protein
MPEDLGDVRKISFVWENEIITVPYGGNLIEVGKVTNGGVRDTMEVLAWLASMTGQGMMGNIAWDGVKLACKSLKLRMRWGEENDKRAYLSYIGQLSVAATFRKSVNTTVVSCEPQRDYWEVVVLADGKTFRVQIPPDDPRPNAISVDVD